MQRLIYTLALGVGLASAGPALAQDIEAKMTQAGCLACHQKDKKVVGPSYKDVAAKYKGQADAVAKLSEKVRKGSVGVWGPPPIPMPATGPDKISDADLKAAIEWVLKQ